MRIGKISENILVRSVLKNVAVRPELQIGAVTDSDCAIFNGQISAMGYVADEKIPVGRPTVTDMEGLPVTLGNPLIHAVLRADNNMAAGGAVTETVMQSLSLPSKMREIRLKELTKEAAEFCRARSIVIAGGHTETVPLIDRPVISVTAMGRVSDAHGPAKRRRALPGDTIIMTKWIGLSGAVRLTIEHMEELKRYFPAFFLRSILELEQFYSIRREAEICAALGYTSMTDVGDGGIFAALWKLGKRDNVGISADMRKIAVLQDIMEIAGFYELNPYQIRSDGCLLCATDNPDKLLPALEEQGIKGTAIGTVTEGCKRSLSWDGEERFLTEPLQDDTRKLWYNGKDVDDFGGEP